MFDDPSIPLFSLFLLAVSAWLMISHLRSWRRHQGQDLDAEDFDYRRRQFRRRMQTGAMLGILAVALGVGQPLTEWLHSAWFFVAFWIGVLLVVCWVALLAVVDVWATKHHFGRLQHRWLVEQAKLESEVRRIQSVRGNGKGGIGGGRTAERGGTEQNPSP